MTSRIQLPKRAEAQRPQGSCQNIRETLRSTPSYYPDPAYLKEIADAFRDSFRQAMPFSHVVLDELFPGPLLDLLISEIPPRSDPHWIEWGSGSRSLEICEGTKLWISDEVTFGPVTRNFMLQLNSATFIAFLEELTGHYGLVPDPTFRGGGVHSTGRGGRLLIHADADRHPLGRWFSQRLNVIIFLNKNWRDAYGGALELWSRDGRSCVKRIAPTFNRTVICESGTDTFHGHPFPLNCPKQRSRLSLASYYYVIARSRDKNYSGWNPRVRWIEP
jgi:hypothetical protein